MTPEELKRIANTSGFGTGAIARDQIAAETRCRNALPDPSKATVEETSTANLRWNEGVLEQMFHIATYENGFAVGSDVEWRAVESVDDQPHSTEDG